MLKLFSLLFLICLVYAQTQVEEVWVASKGGSVDIIDISTDTVIKSITIPTTTWDAQYIAQVGDNVFVTNKNNSEIYVFTAAPPYDQIQTISVNASGLFHMWSDGARLFVTASTSDEFAVIDPADINNVVVDVYPVPSDLAAAYIPHDITADANNVFMTLITGTGQSYLVKYSKTTFQEVDRIQLAGDCHVAQNSNSHLWVPCGVLHVIDRTTLSILATYNESTAHGDWVTDEYVYIGNIASNGVSALVVFDVNPDKLGVEIGRADTSRVIPHNIVSVAGDTKVYETHSEAGAGFVSVFNVNNGIPTYVTEIATTRNTPFGIISIKYTPVASSTSGSATATTGTGTSGASALTSWLF